MRSLDNLCVHNVFFTLCVYFPKNTF